MGGFCCLAATGSCFFFFYFFFQRGPVERRAYEILETRGSPSVHFPNGGCIVSREATRFATVASYFVPSSPTFVTSRIYSFAIGEQASSSGEDSIVVSRYVSSIMHAETRRSRILARSRFSFFFFSPPRENLRNFSLLREQKRPTGQRRRRGGTGHARYLVFPVLYDVLSIAYGDQSDSSSRSSRMLLARRARFNVFQDHE